MVNKQLPPLQRELSEAEANVERLRPVVLNFRGTIAALLDPAANSETTDQDRPVRRGNSPVAGRTLKRTPLFEKLSTIAAVKEILSGAAEPLMKMISCEVFTISAAMLISHGRKNLSDLN